MMMSAAYGRGTVRGEPEAGPIQPWDVADFLTRPAPNTKWLVKGLLPLGGAGDVFGPPGEGKTSLLYHLGLCVAEEAHTWFGLEIAAHGPVAVILGHAESSGCDATHRNFARLAQGLDLKLEPGRLVVYPSPATWKWKRKDEEWRLTTYGERLTQSLSDYAPTLVIVDSTWAIAEGGDQLDNTHQYRLAESLQNWAANLSTTVLTISHSNQASRKQEVFERLHFYSRAGGNGAPGALRWMAGVAKLRPEDASALGNVVTRDSIEDRHLFAFGVAKHNEIRKPDWHYLHPALFEIRPTGDVLLSQTGSQVKQAIAMARDSIPAEVKAKRRHKKYGYEAQSKGY